MNKSLVSAEKCTDNEKAEALRGFAVKLTASATDIPPVFAKVLYENFWDLT